MDNAARELKRAEQLIAYCRYYDAARAFARLVSIDNQCDDQRDYVIITGGGPGITTQTLAHYTYSVGFVHYDMGLASALAVVLTAILVAVGVVYIRLILPRREVASS